MGSADLMPRNLNRRVEILFPVQDPAIVRRLRDEILSVYLNDNLKTRVLRPDGAWEHIWPSEGEEPLNAQEWFVAQAREAVRRQEDE
jgi:polyphosphate kinase